MKMKSLLVQIRPCCFARWRSLPLFDPLLDDFLRWMHDQHYTDSTLDSYQAGQVVPNVPWNNIHPRFSAAYRLNNKRSEEHTSELQSLRHLVCRLLLEKSS